MIVSSAQALPDKTPSIVIFGQPGAGKTTLSFTLDAPLLYDADQGIDRAIQTDRPDYIPGGSYADFKKFIFGDDPESLAAMVRENGYKTFIIDTLGTFLDDVITPYLIATDPKNGRAGGLSLSGWGSLATEFNLVRNRIREIGLVFCMIAHRKSEEDGGDKQWKLSVKGSSSDIVERSCDMIGYVFFEGNNQMIEFDPTSIHLGKNPAGVPKTKVPRHGTPAFEGFLQKNVVDAFLKSRRKKSEAQIEAQKAIKDYKEKIDALTDAAGFNAFSEALNEDRKTVLTQVRHMIRERAKELAISYDKDSQSWTKTASDASENQS